MFSDEQIKKLRAPLEKSRVKTREQSGTRLSYLEGHDVIRAANDIFGFGHWSTEIIEHSLIGQREFENRQGRKGFEVAYRARVKVTVWDAGPLTAYEDVGYGNGIDYNNPLAAHELAMKEAVTDAEKRALRHLGDQFGLALYDKKQEHVVDTPAAPAPVSAVPANPQDVALADAKTLQAFWVNVKEKLGSNEEEVHALMALLGMGESTKELSAAELRELYSQLREAKSA